MTKCPICEKKFKKDQIVQARDGYFYLICHYCTGGILMPRERALKELKTAYQSQYFDWKEATGMRKYLNKFRLYKSYSDWISSTFFRKKGKLLDIGAGIPDFVLKMKENGWDSFALEISKDQVELIANHINKNHVWQGDFEKKIISANFFDVLTFWHMLEHLIKPAEAIRKSSRILKSNGMIFAEFPNFDSLNLKLFKKNYCHFDLPGHLVYYNKKSLVYLFSQNGFKNIRISYPLKLNGSFSLNLMKMINTYIGLPYIGIIFFYLTLPISILLAVVNSYLGKTDLMRISAQKA